ncbi:MAG: sugar ABC transporter substrate-binding protein [Lachnospiraceae bacterium]|nr:sugar ABC transporter substrate-binding protein [Lachnospiraceae bacterium]
MIKRKKREKERAQTGRLIKCFVVTSLFLMTIMGLTGCAKREKVITIGMFAESNWGVPSGTVYEIMDDAIARFEKENPGVKVVYTSGIMKEDYSEWLAEQLLKGTEPDVFVILSEDFNNLASLGAMYDLQDFIDKDTDFNPNLYYSAAFQYGQWKNQQFGLPYESVPTLMFVNKTLLQEEQIALPETDWTWDDFYRICAAVTKDTDRNGTIDQFGCYNYTWKNAAYSNGCVLFDETGKECYVNNKQMEEAVQFVENLQSLTAGYTVSSKDFDLGKVAFQPMPFSEYRTYAPYPWRIKKYMNFEWGCIPLPAGPSGNNVSELSTQLYGISARTKEPTLSWKFLKTLTYETEIQKEIIDYSQGASPLKKVMNADETIRKLNEDVPGNNNMNIQMLNDVLNNSSIAPKFRKYDGAMEVIDEGIANALQSDNNIRTSLITLQRKVNAYLNN